MDVLTCLNSANQSQQSCFKFMARLLLNVRHAIENRKLMSYLAV